jgi:hypothetical protein
MKQYNYKYLQADIVCGKIGGGAVWRKGKGEIYRWLGGVRGGKMTRAVLHAACIVRRAFFMRAAKDFRHAPFHQACLEHGP